MIHIPYGWCMDKANPKYMCEYIISKIIHVF